MPGPKKKGKARPSRKVSAPAEQPSRRALHYKVVELSNVDEASLERTLNEWCPLGWVFDGVQFAMRDSSKRPSMAFVFFTREGEALPQPMHEPADNFRTEHESHAHLKRIADVSSAAPTTTDAWARLQALVEESDE